MFGKDGFVGVVIGWFWVNDIFGVVFDFVGDSEDDIVIFLMMRMVKVVLYNFWWLGRLVNGSDIMFGNYRYGLVIFLEWVKCYYFGLRC